MLKRNGEPCERPGNLKLNRGETEAFNEAYEAIQDELHALEGLKQNVKDMAADPMIFTIPGGPEAGSVIHLPNVPVDRWQICSPLLKLRESQIFLCERSLQGMKEFAVIEKFKSDSPYAQANGNAEVLMAGSDPVLLVEQYAAGAQRTLRTMASNLSAKAHRIVWQRYASTSPSRVILAIADRCLAAASLDRNVQQKPERSSAFQSPNERKSRTEPSAYRSSSIGFILDGTPAQPSQQRPPLPGATARTAD